MLPQNESAVALLELVNDECEKNLTCRCRITKCQLGTNWLGTKKNLYLIYNRIFFRVRIQWFSYIAFYSYLAFRHSRVRFSYSLLDTSQYHTVSIRGIANIWFKTRVNVSSYIVEIKSEKYWIDIVKADLVRYIRIIN